MENTNPYNAEFFEERNEYKVYTIDCFEEDNPIPYTVYASSLQSIKNMESDFKFNPDEGLLFGKEIKEIFISKMNMKISRIKEK